MFKDLIDKTIEFYIYDTIIKIKKNGDHLTQLKEVFESLSQHNMKINQKNVFLVSL